MDGQTKTTEKRHIISYYLDVSLFADSDSDGIGDLHGLIDRLDYIADLGVDEIGFSGIANFPFDRQGKLSDDDDGCHGEDYVCQLLKAASRRNLALRPDFQAIDQIGKYLAGAATSSHGLRELLVYYCYKNNDGPIIFDYMGQPRLTSSYGRLRNHMEIAKMFATLQMTLPGTPYLCQGQELGMLDYAPLPWGYDVDSDIYAVSVASQDSDETSILNYYRRVVALRKSSLILQDGETQIVEDRRHVFGFLRAYGEEGIMVVANISNKTVRPHVPLVGNLLISSYEGRVDLTDNELQPFEVIVARV